jgi:SAM-dependent methyltransferase
MSAAAYYPSVFNCPNTEVARAIILTPENGLSTNERWERETSYLSEMIEWPADARLILDYGCGIGRMMKATADRAVLGVDISPTMRAHGVGYLRDRDDYAFVSPTYFETLIERGLRAQGAMAIWSLQHVLSPSDVIRQVFNALLPGAPFYVVNRETRYVPKSRDEGIFAWFDDGINIGDCLESGGFVLVQSNAMPETLCAPGAWLRRYERATI